MSRQARTRRPQAAPAVNSLPAPAAPVVRAGTQGGGQALAGHTNAAMSARFGHDFSQVRIHTDSRAEESAQEMGANAYTVGSDIVFGGHYTPGSPDSERLLAHELTHVVQQSRGGAGDGSRASARGDASEREADALASQVVQGRNVDVQAAPQAAVARESWLDDWKFLPPTWKGSTDDTHDQRPGAAQDRDRQRQQDDDKREAQRRGETDPRPKWWEGLLGPQKTSPPAGPGFGPKDSTTLPYDPNNPLHMPTLPGLPPPGPITPLPTDDTPVPHGPVPFAPDIPGAPNPYDKDKDTAVA